MSEAQSNIKKADVKLISLANIYEKRQVEFSKWNDTLAEKLQYLRSKISEARNTADGVSDTNHMDYFSRWKTELTTSFFIYFTDSGFFEVSR